MANIQFQSENPRAREDFIIASQLTPPSTNLPLRVACLFVIRSYNAKTQSLDLVIYWRSTKAPSDSMWTCWPVADIPVSLITQPNPFFCGNHAQTGLLFREVYHRQRCPEWPWPLACICLSPGWPGLDSRCARACVSPCAFSLTGLGLQRWMNETHA